MRRKTVRIILLLATVTACFSALVSPSSAAVSHHAKRITTDDFPDPGFAKFGARYYVYATGPGFRVISSTSPDRGYTAPHASMPKIPSWVGNGPDGRPHLWAPHVVRVRANGAWLYVMYFTGFKKSWGANCVGVATSHYPDRNFVARKTTFCGPNNSYEAIDPNLYVSAQGRRYLVLKISQHNARNFQIRGIRLDTATGTSRVAGVSTKIVASSTSMMEAPAVFRHGGKVWMLTSRGNFLNCTYNTDVWVADEFWAGTFHRVKTLMSRSTTGLCGPGGAEVIQDGTTTRVAFHAYPDANRNGLRDSTARQAYVGVLKWASSGRPYLF